MCESQTWITDLIGIMLFVGGCLCVVLMQKAEKDQQINRVDSKPFRSARRLAFIAVAMAAFVTIMAILAKPEAFLPMLLALFTATATLLFIDILALDHRPPENGRKTFVSRIASLADPSRLRSMLTVFRRQ